MLILVCMNKFQLAEDPGKEGERNTEQACMAYTLLLLLILV
jgi:hypothetical protein